ncbi:unnamed protein product [Rhizophagus irregularis]|uniref:Uncharacterized protein n=2 Tax=Rhizophagus irregularis TaxID=588596 RepID=A0A916E9P2_9GLOM|nr:unnamed protein product [Rhizophagus irregularis]CAB4419541.1 unnamed protein product [Rhizophagus irregularis]CAB5179325.1 unnamed protein product [Rhizophagus irregularis]CAB5371420.1 unnamed protein product [Rhizophagus irregularis]
MAERRNDYLRGKMGSERYNFNMKQALVAGGIAGTAVDVALFPLDTLKTRLQSKSGFKASGGFRGIYSGLTSAVIGSSPGEEKKK